MKKFLLFLAAVGAAFAQPTTPLSNTRFSGTNNVFLNGATIKFSAGSLATPSVQFTGDVGSGFYQVGVGNIGIAAGGELVVDIKQNTVTFAHKVGVTAELGVGGAPVTSTGISILSNDLAGFTSYGISSTPTYTASNTTGAIGGYFKITTTAAPFTMANGRGLYVDTPVIGAASAIVTNTGLYVANQGATDVANAIAVDIAAQSGAAGLNLGLRNAGSTTLTGAVTMGSTLTLGGVTSTGVTGTGNLVFSNMPTLTTPNIGAATGTSVVLSGAGTFGTSASVGPTVTAISTTSAGYLIQTSGNGAARSWALVANSTTYGDFALRQSNALAGDPIAAGTDALYISASRAITLGTASSITAAASTVLTLSGGSGATGVVTSGDLIATGDLTVSGGNVGVGTAVDAAMGLTVVSTLTGASQRGINSIPIVSGSVSSYAFNGKLSTASASSIGTGAVYIADSPTVGGGGATVGTQYGLFVANQGAAGITNVIAVDIAAQSGAATTNVGLRNAGTTILGASGNQIVAVYTGTATLNFGSILAAGSEDLTITVTGAAVNDVVIFGPPATMLAGAVFNAWVTSANTVTVRCNNAGSIAVDPASATYRATVMSH